MEPRVKAKQWYRRPEIMSDFGALRSQVREKEAEGDALLSQLSQLLQNSAETAALEADVDANLASRATLVKGLYDLAYKPGAEDSVLHHAERHAELLSDHKRTHKRLKIALSQERSRQMLLSSVRQDIQTHRAGSGGSGSASNAAAGAVESDRFYMDESNRVRQSHSLVDTLLANAYEARAEMMRQQNTLKDVQKRMLQVASRVPGISTLIAKIHTRQKRNSLVLAAVVVVCVLFIYFVR